MTDKAQPTYHPARSAELSQLDLWDRGPTPNFVPVRLRTLLLRLLVAVVLFSWSAAVVAALGYGAIALLLPWVTS